MGLRCLTFGCPAPRLYFVASVYDAGKIAKTDCTAHENVDNIMLVVVHMESLMEFVHALYERAASEA